MWGHCGPVNFLNAKWQMAPHWVRTTSEQPHFDSAATVKFYKLNGIFLVNLACHAFVISTRLKACSQPPKCIGPNRSMTTDKRLGIKRIRSQPLLHQLSYST